MFNFLLSLPHNTHTSPCIGLDVGRVNLDIRTAEFRLSTYPDLSKTNTQAMGTRVIYRTAYLYGISIHLPIYARRDEIC